MRIEAHPLLDHRRGIGDHIDTAQHIAQQMLEVVGHIVERGDHQIVADVALGDAGAPIRIVFDVADVVGGLRVVVDPFPTCAIRPLFEVDTCRDGSIEISENFCFNYLPNSSNTHF